MQGPALLVCFVALALFVFTGRQLQVSDQRRWSHSSSQNELHRLHEESSLTNPPLPRRQESVSPQPLLAEHIQGFFLPLCVSVYVCECVCLSVRMCVGDVFS